jgi:hypothetical protein
MSFFFASPDILVLSSAFMSLFVFFVIHIFLFRAAGDSQSARMMFCSTICGAIVNTFLVLLTTSLFHEFSLIYRAFLFVFSMAVYLLGVYHYMCWVFGMAEAAIRIRLLVTLQKCPQARGTLNQIYEDYNASAILTRRLERLTGSGHLFFNGTYYSGASVSVIIQKALVDLLRALLGIREIQAK